jgi:hypothetical protein
MTISKLCSWMGAVALATSSACLVKGGAGDTMPGAGDGDDDPGDVRGAGGLAGTMAEAAVYRPGDAMTAAAECHTSGYMKFDVPAGEPFQLEIGIDAPDEACLSVHYLRSTGGAVDGMMLEICSADAPRTLDVEGQDGGSFLQISESGVCQGATVRVAVR